LKGVILKMSVIRQDITTKDWTIFAIDRSKRPSDFKEIKEKKVIKEFDRNCPFCRGNEKMTPEDIMSVKDKNGDWLIRVVPNKFPILEPGEIKKCGDYRRINGPYFEVNGIGNHEVIIESPEHNENLCHLSPGQVRKIIEIYKTRFIELSKDKGCQLVVIFRNHGNKAGTSLVHPHSQLVAIPFMPAFIRSKFYESERYFDDYGECVYCKMIAYEKKIKKRIIYENEDFISIAPYASVVPYNILILPKAHQACFAQIPETAIENFASVLIITLKKLYDLLDNPDYNYIIDSAPFEQIGNRHYHWHLEILPRLITRAGFEIGSGINVNTILPEECAESLRKESI
jgi:UDPglucose--hexose-1-phosphate uridylyltransferase